MNSLSFAVTAWLLFLCHYCLLSGHCDNSADNTDNSAGNTVMTVNHFVDCFIESGKVCVF